MDVVQRVDHAENVHGVLLDGGAAFPGFEIMDADAFAEVGGVHLILRHVDVVVRRPAVVDELGGNRFQRAFHKRAREMRTAVVVFPATVVAQHFTGFFRAEVGSPVVQHFNRCFMDFFAVSFAEEVQADADAPHKTGMCPSLHNKPLLKKVC